MVADVALWVRHFLQKREVWSTTSQRLCKKLQGMWVGGLSWRRVLDHRGSLAIELSQGSPAAEKRACL